MVDRFLFSVAKVRERIDGAELIVSHDREQYGEEVLSLWNQYQGDFKVFKDRGVPVAIYLHTTRRVARDLCKALGEQPAEDYGAWKTFVSDQVTPYRNAFAHNPLLGRVVDGDIKVPKDVSKYSRWSRIWYPNGQELHNMGEQEQRDFVNKDFRSLRELVEECQNGLETRTNTLWTSIINLLQSLANGPNYRQMAAQDGASRVQIPVAGEVLDFSGSRVAGNPASSATTAKSGSYGPIHQWDVEKQDNSPTVDLEGKQDSDICGDCKP